MKSNSVIHRTSRIKPRESGDFERCPVTERTYLLDHTTHFIAQKCLLPLNGTRWFGTDVVNYAVDTFDLVDNPTGNDFQYVIGYAVPVGSHKVGCLYRTDGNDVFVAPFIPHNPYSTER